MASVRLGLFWRSWPIGILTCTFTRHMTGVLPEYQNRGIGRQVKLAQRDDALSRGMNLIEWTFDPVEVLNAHFNRARLGAIMREYLPNLYGRSESSCLSQRGIHGRIAA